MFDDLCSAQKLLLLERALLRALEVTQVRLRKEAALRGCVEVARESELLQPEALQSQPPPEAALLPTQARSAHCLAGRPAWRASRGQRAVPVKL